VWNRAVLIKLIYSNPIRYNPPPHATRNQSLKQNKLNRKAALITNIITIILLLSATHAIADTAIAGTATENAAGAKTISVSTTAFKDVAVNITHTIGGIVPAAQNSNISAQISAIILAFHVDTGHATKKGDPLVSLDCRENRLKLKVASTVLNAERVQLAHAKKQFNQAKKLNKQGSISKELYNKREAEENRLKAMVENKKASHAIAQINVERCEIKAPYDGYITNREASIGELTKPGTHLLHLISKSNNLVEVKINNRLLDSFTAGKNYQFEFNNKKYPLKVDFILPILDTTTRNHIARLSFVDTQAITGSVGKVSWQEAAPSIPSSYIVQRDNKRGIFIVTDVDEEKGGTTKGIARFVEINNISEGKAASLTLDDDTPIITNGRFSVNDGDKLLIIKN
jgi:RND family efflux transporter MFP subunit